MKKLSSTIIITTLSIIAQNSFAERSGLFAGVDLTKSSSAIESQWTCKEDKFLDSILKKETSRSGKSSKIGIGANVSYAYNYKNFFIAPGLAIHSIDTKDTSVDIVTKPGYTKSNLEREFSIKSRTSIKADLGYEIADRLAIFVPVGINIVNYQIKSDFFLSKNPYTGKGTDASPFVGAGFSLKLIDNIYLNGEYNYTTINYKKPMYDNKSTKATIDIEGKAHINTMRAGISWNFQI